MYQTYINRFTGGPQKEYFCSACRTKLHKRGPTKFCPFCGAKMANEHVEVE